MRKISLFPPRIEFSGRVSLSLSKKYFSLGWNKSEENVLSVIIAQRPVRYFIYIIYIYYLRKEPLSRDRIWPSIQAFFGRWIGREPPNFWFNRFFRINNPNASERVFFTHIFYKGITLPELPCMWPNHTSCRCSRSNSRKFYIEPAPPRPSARKKSEYELLLAPPV